MKPLLAGQAVITRQDGKVSFVVCDERANLPLGAVAFAMIGVTQDMEVDGVVVPVIAAVLRLTSQDGSRCYAAWIDEQEQGVLELLAAQSELPVILATPEGERVGQASTENGMREFARKMVGKAAALSGKSPWTPQHFAVAQLKVMAQYFSAAELWRQVGGEQAVRQ